MLETNETEVTRTPWHLWVVGIVALMWSAMGAMDYVMTETHNEAYMGDFTAEQLEFFYDMPAWAIATWAIAVWGGVVGAILLLIRRRLAVPVFLASLIGMVVTTFQNYVLSDGMQVMGSAFILTFNAVIFLLALAFYLYSRAMLQRNILA